MTDVPIYINERAVTVKAGIPAGQAVAGIDPSWAEALAAGKGYLTDGRGIRLDPGAPLAAGAIVRVVISARAAGEGPDADP